MNQGTERLYPGEKVWRIELNSEESLYTDSEGRRVVGEALGPGRYMVHSEGVKVIVDGEPALLMSGAFQHSFLATADHSNPVKLELYLGRSTPLNPVFWRVPEHVTEFAGWVVPPAGWSFVEPVYTIDALDPNKPTGAPSSQVCRPVKAFFLRNDEDRDSVGWSSEEELDFDWVGDFPAPFLRHRKSTEFSIELPKPNDGIQLARFYDARTGRQRARVLVDGFEAGEWYTPMANSQEPIQADSFGIPPSLTDGKTSIRIRIEPTPDSPPWTVAWYGVDALIERVL